MSNPFGVYKAGGKLKQKRFAWVWDERVVKIPETFEQDFADYCEEYELDSEDEDSVEMFIAEHIDGWEVVLSYSDGWEETSRDTQEKTWEVLDEKSSTISGC